MKSVLSEIAFFTPDVEGTTAFYGRSSGGGLTRGAKAPPSFDLDGVTLLVHRTTEPAERMPPGEDHIAFSVDDVDAACEALRAQGVEVLGPHDHDWGRSAYLRDPDGRLIELQ